jgi:hypothetical protein
MVVKSVTDLSSWSMLFSSIVSLRLTGDGDINFDYNFPLGIRMFIIYLYSHTERGMTYKIIMISFNLKTIIYLSIGAYSVLLHST